MTQSFNSSLKKTASRYIRLLGVKVTSSSVQKDLEENPYYPSLLSLSDTFNRYHIENSAYQVSAIDFSLLDPPFIAFVNMQGTGNDFVLVTDITDDTVRYYYNNRKPDVVKKEDFLRRYQKIIWIAKPGEKSGEEDFTSRLKKEKSKKNSKRIWAAAVVLLALLAVTLNFTTPNAWAFSIMAGIKFMGTTATILLLIYQVDKSNSFVKNLCNTVRKVNCDAVLNSRGSKIWGISWGEIGFFYFAATATWLLLPGIPFTTRAAWLAIGNAFATPYIIFSVYYQWRIVKQWCALCMTTQLLLALELAWGIVLYWQHPWTPAIQPLVLPALLFCILLPVVAWYGLKQVFVKARDHDFYSAAYKRQQYNPEIFNNLLQQQVKAPGNWQHLGITIGNPNATTTIIKVCNPYCRPCAGAHNQLDKLLKQNRDVQLKIIFTATNNVNDKGSMVVKHLLAIATEGDVAKTRQALDDWYGSDKKDYALFAGKYPVNGELMQQDMKIEAMGKWCRNAEIFSTPTLFVNGYRIPENYDAEKLTHIL